MFTYTRRTAPAPYGVELHEIRTPALTRFDGNRVLASFRSARAAAAFIAAMEALTALQLIK